MSRNLTYGLLFYVLLSGCNRSRLPVETFAQYSYHQAYRLEDHKLIIEIGNPLFAPLRVWVFSASDSLQMALNTINPVLIPAKSDTLITLSNIHYLPENITFSSRLGDTQKEIQPIMLELPFLPHKTYRIIQGNNTTGTHSSDWSRYALDFDLNPYDTICAATNGYVVGIVDSYKYGGKGEEWKSFGNFITLYDDESGLFTQYVHLVENGSLVRMGDRVIRGQPIALSGNTGQSDTPHLHFNCYKPIHSNDGLISIPYEFLEGYSSQSLKRDDLVTK